MSQQISKSSRFGYIVEPFQEDFTGRLSWYVLGSRILAAASMHADSHGFGMKQLLPLNHAWVLSRMAVEMNEMPRVGESYAVETWIRRIYRTFTDRCFAVLRPDGTPFGYAYTIWALIDTETRRPIDLEQLPHGGFLMWADKDKKCDIKPFSRIRVSETTPLARLTARYSDLDINNHVNSIRYIEHVLDLFPNEQFANHRVRRVETAYHGETYADEELMFYMHQSDSQTFDVEIRKNTNIIDNGTSTPLRNGGQPVCDCRVTFE